MSFLVRIRIIGSEHPSNGSGYGSGRPQNIRIWIRTRIQNTGTFTSFFKDKKVIKKLQDSRKQGFSYYVCWMMYPGGPNLTNPDPDVAPDPDAAQNLQHWFSLIQDTVRKSSCRTVRKYLGFAYALILCSTSTKWILTWRAWSASRKLAGLSSCPMGQNSW